MTFFFTWRDAPEPFDPVTHGCQELDIFALYLIHEEGDYARLHLTVSLDTPLPPQRWGILSVALTTGERVCVFQGELQENCKSSGDFFKIIELIACPPDSAQQLQKLLKTWRQSTPVYDPLLVPPGHDEDPHMIRFFQPLTFYWDPVNLLVSLDPLLQMGKGKDMTSLMDPSSLTFRYREAGPFELNVMLEAQWVQQIRGFLNLSPIIAKLFPEGKINTYTGNAFKATWPRTGHFLGHSGYWIAASKLEEIDPPHDALRISRPLPSTDATPLSKPLVARRRWFRGKLLIGWTRQQKRREIISFSLSSHDTFKKGSHLSETLLLRLQPLCSSDPLPFWEPATHYQTGDIIQEAGHVYHCLQDHQTEDTFAHDLPYWDNTGILPDALPDRSASSFFRTPRGQKILETGIEIAQTKRISRSRILEVFFDIPYQLCPLLSPKDEIYLKDPRFPKGEVTGKVLCTEVKVDGETGEHTRQVSLGVCVEDFTNLRHPEHTGPRTVSGIPYFSYDDQMPRAEEEAPSRDTQIHPRIQKLALLNGPDVQEMRLQEAEAFSSRPSFQDVQTRLFLKFQKLQTQETLTHHINVRVLA